MRRSNQKDAEKDRSKKTRVKEIQYTVMEIGVEKTRVEKTEAATVRRQMQTPWMKERLERRIGWQKTRSRQVAERYWGRRRSREVVKSDGMAQKFMWR